MTTDLLGDLRHAVERKGQKWEQAKYASHSSGSSLGEPAALALREDPEYREVHLDEAVARSSYLKVLDKLASIRGLMKECGEVLLPMSTQRLTLRVIAEEQHCLKLIKRTHQLIVVLKGAEVEETAPAKQQCMRQMRDNLATLLTLELGEASQDLVDIRNRRRAADYDRTCRLLRYAFPEATEMDIETSMQFPELAAAAVDRRLSEGAKCPRLDVVTAELETSKVGMQKRLEAESMELELLFFHFNELVGKNDVVLTEIENNIQSTLKQTEAAVQNLREARGWKLSGQRRMLMMQSCCALVVMYLLYTTVGPLLWGTREKPMEVEAAKAAGMARPQPLLQDVGVAQPGAEQGPPKGGGGGGEGGGEGGVKGSVGGAPRANATSLLALNQWNAATPPLRWRRRGLALQMLRAMEARQARHGRRQGGLQQAPAKEAAAAARAVPSFGADATPLTVAITSAGGGTAAVPE